MTRYPVFGSLLIGIGFWIMILSWPVSESSHAIAAEVDRLRPKKAAAWKVAGGALQAGADGWKFAAGRNDNVFVQCLQFLVAVISVAWCCCVSIVTWISVNAIEPIGEALGIAASYSVITFAVLLGGFGALHIGIGAKLLHGGELARVAARSLFFLDGAQGVFYIAAAGPIWVAAGPGFGCAALGVGLVLTALGAFAMRALRRDERKAEPDALSNFPTA